MDQRFAVGLHDQQRRAPRANRDIASPPPSPASNRRSRRAAGCRAPSRGYLVAHAAGLRVVLDVAVAAMAEEGEVIGLEPAQEFLFLVGAGGARSSTASTAACRIACQSPTASRTSARRGPAPQRVRRAAPDRPGGRSRLHQRFGGRALVGIGELEEIAIEVAAYRHHRMGQQMDRAPGGSARW